MGGGCVFLRDGRRDTQVKGRGFSVAAAFQLPRLFDCKKQLFPFFDPCGLSAGAAYYPTITVDFFRHLWRKEASVPLPLAERLQ